METEEKEDDEEKYTLRRKMTVSRNVQAYKAKETSLVEKYLIPAQAYQKQRKESQVLSQSSDLNFQVEKMDATFMKKVRESKFQKYCQENVKKRTRWLKEIPLETLVSYQSGPLGDPLTELQKAQAGQALGIFNLLLQYQKDENPLGTVSQIVQQLMPGKGESVSP